MNPRTCECGCKECARRLCNAEAAYRVMRRVCDQAIAEVGRHSPAAAIYMRGMRDQQIKWVSK